MQLIGVVRNFIFLVDDMTQYALKVYFNDLRDFV